MVVMVVLTVLMLVAFLALIPLRIAIGFCLDVATKCVFVRATVFFVPVFREKLQLQGKYIVCSGSVDTQLNLLEMDGKSGINLAKALVFDSVNVTFALNYAKHSPLLMPIVESFCYLATVGLCTFTNCRTHTATCLSKQDCVFGKIVVSVSLAEIFAVLIRQSLRTRKTAQ